MKLPLQQGNYQARSHIANAQMSINVYSEPNPPDAPFPVTAYPTPGLDVLHDFSPFGTTGGCRGVYAASNGTVVAVFDTDVWAWYGTEVPPNKLGTLASNSGQPVSMVDNGDQFVLVDGSPNGYACAVPLLAITGSLSAPIVDPAFYGSNRVDLIDTFIIFNQPGTRNFYTTTSQTLLPLDPLYIAAKAGYNDLLVCAVVLHDNIWLLGAVTTEVWFNSGGAQFPFARMPNSVIQQGCVAVHSPIVVDNALYWIGQDRWGQNIAMRGQGYEAQRISNYAIEDEWNKYPTLRDARGMAYQLGGHEMVCWWFPTANKWWAYDTASQFWHRRTYGGLVDAWLPSCMAGWSNLPGVSAPDEVLVGDRSAPRILLLHREAYTDIGVPIVRQRSMVHLQADGQRVNHQRFSASMDGSGLAPDTVSLDWSDDAGKTYGTPVPQTVANRSDGQYQWRRLGYARDRVYRLTWQGGGECALNGAYIDVTPHGT